METEDAPRRRRNVRLLLIAPIEPVLREAVAVAISLDVSGTGSNRSRLRKADRKAAI
jgi:hypothetical protein